MKRIVRSLLFTALAIPAFGNSGPTSPALFDTSGAEAMLKVVRAIHDGEDPARVEKLFDRAMALESYRICVRHFTDPARPVSNQVNAAQYKTFVMSLLKGKADTRNNRRLGYMAPLYEDAVKNPQKYGRAIARFKRIPESDVRAAFDLARQWLPPGIVLKGRVQLVLDMGGGAWIFTDEKDTHHISFNLLAMLDGKGDIDGDLFLGTLAHEMHHIGLPDEAFLKSMGYDSLKEDSRLKVFIDFVSPFIAEGLAQKFCSNAPGVLTGKPYPDKPFAAIDAGKRDWDFYMPALGEIHKRFVRDLEWILDGDVSDREAFDTAYADYWTWHAGKKEGRESVLGRRYYYGTELMGVINRGLGKDALFALMADYRKLPDLFNKALRAAGPADREAYMFPRRLAKRIAELSPGGDPGMEEKESIRQSAAGIRRALINNDQEAIGKLYCEDYRGIDVGGRPDNLNMILEAYRPGAVRLEVYEVEEVEIEVFGETGMIRGKGRIRGTFRGQVFQHLVRFTDIYKKSGGIWKCWRSQLTEVTE